MVVAMVTLTRGGTSVKKCYHACAAEHESSLRECAQHDWCKSVSRSLLAMCVHNCRENVTSQTQEQERTNGTVL